MVAQGTGSVIEADLSTFVFLGIRTGSRIFGFGKHLAGALNPNNLEPVLNGQIPCFRTGSAGALHLQNRFWGRPFCTTDRTGSMRLILLLEPVLISRFFLLLKCENDSLRQNRFPR